MKVISAALIATSVTATSGACKRRYTAARIRLNNPIPTIAVKRLRRLRAKAASTGSKERRTSRAIILPPLPRYVVG